MTQQNQPAGQPTKTTIAELAKDPRAAGTLGLIIALIASGVIASGQDVSDIKVSVQSSDAKAQQFRAEVTVKLDAIDQSIRAIVSDLKDARAEQAETDKALIRVIAEREAEKKVSR
jgi:hypothetical protein